METRDLRLGAASLAWLGQEAGLLKGLIGGPRTAKRRLSSTMSPS